LFVDIVSELLQALVPVPPPFIYANKQSRTFDIFDILVRMRLRSVLMLGKSVRFSVRPWNKHPLS
jgi:hypothetical protein